jgi:hypothetical protein
MSSNCLDSLKARAGCGTSLRYPPQQPCSVSPSYPPSFILPAAGETQRGSYPVALSQFSAWRIAGPKSSRSLFVP